MKLSLCILKETYGFLLNLPLKETYGYSAKLTPYYALPFKI